MAFMGRGGSPSIGHSSGGFHGHHHHHIIVYDLTYIAMQMVMIFIILVTILMAIFSIYQSSLQSSVIDPLKDTKEIFINAQLTSVLIFSLLTFFIHIFSTDSSILLERLTIIFIISFLIMLVTFCIKLHLDITYSTIGSFMQFSSVASSSTAEKCLKLYNIFKIKSYATLGLHMLLNIVLICQISKFQKIQVKKDKIARDDAVLFDETQDVRY